MTGQTLVRLYIHSTYFWLRCQVYKNEEAGHIAVSRPITPCRASMSAQTLMSNLISCAKALPCSYQSHKMEYATVYNDVVS